MNRPRALEALLVNYQDFNIGELQLDFDQDKTIELVKRPVQRYSYALMRAALNVFIQHNFADHLNSLAFDRDSFAENVKQYVPQVWPYYLEEAQYTLPSATITQLHPLEFVNWTLAGQYQFGAWHRLNFVEFEVDVLLQITNSKGRLGGFHGLCFLDNDQNSVYQLPNDKSGACQNLGSLHLQHVTDEILEALGISPESAISAIKWQMR